MRLSILILAYCLLAQYCKSQTLEWAGKVGSIYGYENCRAIGSDRWGNMYIAGDFESDTDFDPGIGTHILSPWEYSMDMFVLKLAPNGGLIWVKSIGNYGNDSPSDMAVTPDGFVYVVGAFSFSIDFDPSTDEYWLYNPNASYTDGFILKLDPNGNLVWVRQLGADWSTINCQAVTLDEIGNVYTVGSFRGGLDADPTAGTCILSSLGTGTFVQKLDANGNFLFAKELRCLSSSSISYPTDVQLDPQQNIYLSGAFYGTMDFAPGNSLYHYVATNDLFYAAFFVKLDSLGNFNWVQKIGNGDSDAQACWGMDIVTDAQSNIYATGVFHATQDFNPNANDTFSLTSNGLRDIFLMQYDSSGGFVWAKSFGSIGDDHSYSLELDADNNLYLGGYFYNTVDFGNELLTSGSYYSGFVAKFDNNGTGIWAEKMGHHESFTLDMLYDQNSDILYACGAFNISFAHNYFNFWSSGYYDGFIAKIRQKGITGSVFLDLNHNCIKNSTELGIANRMLTLQPGNYTLQTNTGGLWYVDSLPSGNYQVTVDTSNGQWAATCGNTDTFSVSNNTAPFVVDIGLESTAPCTNPNISIFMPAMRPCFNQQPIYVQVCNASAATQALMNKWVEIRLDSLFRVDTASVAYTSLGNNIYRIEIDTLNPSHCFDFQLYTTLSCDAILGQTLCIESALYVIDSCSLDNIPAPNAACLTPWDNSSLVVNGWCQNDSVLFSVTNGGSGNMSCAAQLRIYNNGFLYSIDSVLLNSNESQLFSLFGEGNTWRLEVDQHPLHPGNSQPNASIELCGNSNLFSPGLINVMAMNDADDWVDIYCGVVSAAFDPNDKTGYPTGVGETHAITPNQELQYVVRFQNTGTDTAFNVVIRDTLDEDLNIFSVLPGVSSHYYQFLVHEQRVLEWRFPLIMLPDSNTNEPASHGFFTFTVSPVNGLEEGTEIKNSAAIYFDFNAPVITNQTLHTVSHNLHFPTAIDETLLPQTHPPAFSVYPNPADKYINIQSENPKNQFFKLFDIWGRALYTGQIKEAKTPIDIGFLSNGCYIINIYDGNTVYPLKFCIMH